MSQKYFICIFTLFVLFVSSCEKDSVSPAKPTAEDRDKFIGTWVGIYECSNLPSDTLIINEDSGELDVLVALHVFSHLDPEFLNGELTEPDMITIPEQIIAGFEGSGEITYKNNNTLSLKQKGLGLTCKGSDYIKIE